MSELNISANDLQALPASIGLLRNLRTFYADENLLEFLPAEVLYFYFKIWNLFN